MPLFGFRKDKKYDKDFDNKVDVKKRGVNKNAKPAESKKSDTRVAVATKTISASSGIAVGNVASTIIRPHITEKSGIQSGNGVYTFEVNKNANKNTVAEAVKGLYKVTPIKVGIVNVPIKNIFHRGKRGTVAGYKKAIVTLKSGDKIDFV